MSRPTPFFSFKIDIAHHFSSACETSATPIAPLPPVHTDHPIWTGGAASLLGVPEDLAIISSDLVHFHVNQTYLLAMSSNMFNGFLPHTIPQHFEELEPDGEGSRAWTQDEQGRNILYLPESGKVLNILLFATYNRTPIVGQVAASDVSLPDLDMAVAALKTYGIPIQSAISENSLMFAAFASHCQRSLTSALRVYAIAASYSPDLHALAVYASRFLLSLNLATVTDQLANELGPVYVRRLFSLHLERVQEFKRLMVGIPQAHGPLPYCNDTSGRTLNEAWAFATAYLSWAASPDLPDSRIDDAMNAVMDRFTCNTCKELLQIRFQRLKQDWSLVKVRSVPKHL